MGEWVSRTQHSKVLVFPLPRIGLFARNDGNDQEAVFAFNWRFWVIKRPVINGPDTSQAIRLFHQVVDNLSRSHDFLEITAVIQNYQYCCIIYFVRVSYHLMIIIIIIIMWPSGHLAEHPFVYKNIHYVYIYRWIFYSNLDGLRLFVCHFLHVHLVAKDNSPSQTYVLLLNIWQTMWRADVSLLDNVMLSDLWPDLRLCLFILFPSNLHRLPMTWHHPIYS